MKDSLLIPYKWPKHPLNIDVIEGECLLETYRKVMLKCVPFNWPDCIELDILVSQIKEKYLQMSTLSTCDWRALDTDT